MKHTKVFALLFASAAVFAANKPKCTYTFDATGTHVKWTAFKTSEKLAVGGAFDKVTFKTRKNSGSALMDVINGAKFTIQVNSVNTANPARDATLKAAFFNKISKKEITGEVKKIGAVPRGRMEVELQLNGVTKMVPFDYSVAEDGTFESTAKIDVMDFNLKAQHESLNQACKGLHIGKDGVSKTWTEVDLQLVSVFKKSCS